MEGQILMISILWSCSWTVISAMDSPTLCEKYHIVQKTDSAASVARHYGFTKNEMLANELYYGGRRDFGAGRMICVEKKAPDHNCRRLKAPPAGSDAFKDEIVRQLALIRIDLISPKKAEKGLGLDTTDPYGFCSGVLVSPNAVLTSMTCLTKNESLRTPESAYYQVGLYADQDDSSYRLSYRPVEKILPHPEFNITQRANDLALIFLQPDASQKGEAAVLPNENGLPVCPESMVYFGAWDALGTANYTIDGYLYQIEKHHVKFDWQWKLMDRKLCRPMLFSIVGKTGWGSEKKELTCADSDNELHQTDICVSSNGAPFYVYDPVVQKMTVVGVASWTNWCWSMQLPMVDVFKYVTWIKENI